MKFFTALHVFCCFRLGGHSVLIEYPKDNEHLERGVTQLSAHRCALYATSLDIPIIKIKQTESGFLITYLNHQYKTNNLVDLSQLLFDYFLKALDSQIRDGLLLHAACVQDKYGNVFVLPGNQGNGKTTTTLWLASQGYSIISDELLYINTRTNQIYGLNRPLMIKKGSKDFIPFYSSVTNPNEELINNGEVYVLPLDKTNGHYKKSVPLDHRVHFIYPTYNNDQIDYHFESLGNGSGAGKSPSNNNKDIQSEYVLNHCVNLRSLEKGGLPHVAHIIEKCGAGGTLTFSSFDHLDQFFNPGLIAYQGG